MITITQSSLSTAYIQVLIATGTYDPTYDNVQFAFMLDSYPALIPSDDDWQTASWSIAPGPQYWAQCLVGPANGGIPLTPGLYQVWVKIIDNPQVPVLQQVFLQITS
jgi:hypothetical protein